MFRMKTYAKRRGCVVIVNQNLAEPSTRVVVHGVASDASPSFRDPRNAAFVTKTKPRSVPAHN